MKEADIYKESFNSLLGNSVVVSFVKKVRLRDYRQCTQKRQKEMTTIYEKAFELLIKNKNDPAKFKQAVKDIVCDLFKRNDPNFWFHKFHANYRKNVKGELEFKKIKDYIKGSAILDVGCGGGYLALKCSQEGYTVLTTDVLDCGTDASERLPFKTMTDPSTIPCPDNSVDTALVFFALHHIDSFNLKKVLKELKRIASRIIIREDIYGIPLDNPGFKKVIEKDDLLQEFISLSKEDQLGVLILYDFIDNAFAQGIPEMNFPFQFKTISEWNSIFIENGFKVAKTILIGFKRGKRWTGICHALFIIDPIKK